MQDCLVAAGGNIHCSKRLESAATWCHRRVSATRYGLYYRLINVNNVAVKRLMVVCLATVAADVSLAQLGKTLWEFWDVRKAETNYGVRSDLYHHDLAKNTTAIGAWGLRRYPIKTNSLGFIDRTVRQVPLQSKRYRVLLLGDSFTEGIGVAFENSFAGILHDGLRKHGVEVLNAAVASYSPAIYYRKAKYLIEDVGLHVDEVIVFIDISDIDDEATVYDIDEHDRVIGLHDRPEISEEANAHWTQGLDDALKNNSVLVKFSDTLSHRLFDPDPDYGACRAAGEKALAAMTNLERSLWTVNDTVFEKYATRGLQKAEQNMERLLRVLERSGITLTIAVYPWPDQILYKDVDSKQVRFWKGWAAKNSVGFLNLFPYFVNGDNPKEIIGNYFIPCDMHLNEAGHRLFAKAFFQECRARLSHSRACS